MPSLICVGSCNPNRPDIDKAVAKSVVAETADGKRRVSAMDVGLLLALRALKHTRHSHLIGNQFQCAQCGTSRRYGNEA